ncbi:hypothetical protein [cyanobacterium endosymbiont of Rhopalodia gibberula]|uniref:hypothetical protein n=1 Tax=cyanobacterium endosymbiont of Rhopalodia gibberula TaxID=1763363 RepID=UPI001559EE0E|nr:hypothetical protein [cyanobacterium endosymbiont of Rhopalodia gibberula]
MNICGISAKELKTLLIGLKNSCINWVWSAIAVNNNYWGIITSDVSLLVSNRPL